MGKNESKIRVSIDAKKIEQTNLEILKANFNDIEVEKKSIAEELERNKRYLIEEVLYDGRDLLDEIDRKENKSFITKLIDFIFK